MTTDNVLIKEYFYRELLCKIYFAQAEPKSYFWGECPSLSICIPENNLERPSFEEAKNKLEQSIDELLQVDKPPQTWAELTDVLNNAIAQTGYEEYELKEEVVTIIVSSFIKANKNDSHLKILNSLSFD